MVRSICDQILVKICWPMLELFPLFVFFCNFKCYFFLKSSALTLPYQLESNLVWMFLVVSCIEQTWGFLIHRLPFLGVFDCFWCYYFQNSSFQNYYTEFDGSWLICFFRVSWTKWVFGFLICGKTWLLLLKTEHRGQTADVCIYLQNC